ncbi:MAG TPA: UvrD-helicase domain-containing protein [Bacilli bacterium]|nr:UvrD-helicase domain-containing protein [Bacilli bacterium]
MKELTDSQRQAVEAQGERILVSAGAGSGKTRVLVERFAYLVEQQGLSQERILALTFTDQAACEMKERIMERIGQQNVELRVMTFHRFCGQLLRESPLMAGVDPAFSILPESRAKQVVRDLFLRHLQETQEEELLDWLAHVTPEVELESLLALYQKGCERTLSWPQWRDHTERNQADARKQAWCALVEALEKLVELEQRGGVTAPGTLRRLRSMREAWCSLPAELRSSERGEWSEADVTRLQAALENVFSHVSGSVSKEVKPLMTRLKAWKKDNLWLDLLADRTRELRAALFHLVERVAEDFQAWKREKGWCDFADLQANAYRLLREHPSIRRRYGGLFCHVLVDEYQDTNPLQQAFLETMEQGRREAGQPGSLFMVGDRRQSIYRFRGAEVTGFDAVQANLGEGDRFVELQENFRATPSLFALIREVSARLFAEATVTPSEEGIRVDAEEEPDMELLVPEKEEGRSLTESEARLLARRLRQLGPTVWGETAILLQTRTHLPVFAQALRAYGIPYVLQEDSGFWKRQGVQDFLHLLRVLEDPEDAVALLGFLRGPLAQLPDDLLWEVAQDHGLVQGFWQVEPEKLRHAQRDQVQVVQAALARWREEVTGQSLCDWLYDLFNVEGVAAQIGEPALEVFLQLAEEAEEQGIVTLSALLAWWRELEEQQEKVSGRLESSAEHAVRIMTIHAAKGLEFPVVCLPDLTHRQSVSLNRLHLCEENGFVTKALVNGERSEWGPTLAFDAAIEVEKFASREEKKRLLYVGLTRAEQKVILSGGASAFTEKSSMEECSNWWDWLPFLFPALREQGLRDGMVTGRGWSLLVVTDRAVPEPARLRERLVESVVDRVASVSSALSDSSAAERGRTVNLFQNIPSRKIWRVTELAARLSGMEEEEQASQVFWQRVRGAVSGLAAHEWGQVVHAVFEHLRVGDGESEIREQRIPAALAGIGLSDPALVVEVWERMREDVGVFMGSELWRERCEAVQSEQELPFCVELVRGVWVSGVMDAVWLRPDGGATVVDYKTRRCQTKREEQELVGRYGVQVQLYAAVVEKLLGWKVDKVGVWLTAEGRFVEVGYGSEVREELVAVVDKCVS